MDTVTPEQLAAWRRLCERLRSPGGTVPVSDADVHEFARVARTGWPATMDALEAQTRATAKWIEQHDAVRDTLAEVAAERDRLAARVAELESFPCSGPCGLLRGNNDCE